MNTYMHVTDSMQQNVADTMGGLLKNRSAGEILPIAFAITKVAFSVVVKLWSRNKPKKRRKSAMIFSAFYSFILCGTVLLIL